jgi:hypothetical protein
MLPMQQSLSEPNQTGESDQCRSRGIVIRVYFNRKSAEHIWSVDNGTQKTEIQVDKVIIQGHAETKQDFSVQDRENQPCCWIELEGTLTIKPGAEITAIIRGK